LSLTGCYVVPVQVEEGRPPVYAYAPVPPGPTTAQGPRTAPAAAPYVPLAAVPSAIHVRLYPLNDAAAKLGPLQGIVTDGQSGRGTFTVHAAGEPMQGEATRVPNEFPGFGRVIADALGDAHAQPSGGRRGIANAYGSRGAYANCEYVLSGTATGTGACIFSNGARYQLHFGS